jgi:hypothetical protein
LCRKLDRCSLFDLHKIVDCHMFEMVEITDEGELRNGREAISAMESKTLETPIGATTPTIPDVTLTACEATRLVSLCIELIDLCAKVTGKIDPAVGTILRYARDEALSEALEIGR